MAFSDLNHRNVTQPLPTRIIPPAPRYKECMKNHTIINQIGLQYHTLDGCCEFLPAGPDGSADALKCDGCGCHRCYHRREDVYPFYHPRPAPYVSCRPPRAPHASAPAPAATTGGAHANQAQQQPQPRQLALPSSQSESNDKANLNGGAMLEAGGTSGVKKRFRTKFTPEQKAKMYAMAERIGWRMQSSDAEIVQRFCNDAGIERHVFKVWLHNHKDKSRSSNTSGSDNNNNN